MNAGTFIKAELIDGIGRITIYTYDSLLYLKGSIMGFLYYDSISYQDKRIKAYKAGEIVASLPVSWFTNN